jgi:cytochrome c biogenesis protein CcmG, thiol:disulfide interchange protein DsbE
MLRKLLVLSLVLLPACAGGASEESLEVDDIPAITAPEFEAHLAELDRPAVVNVWASWCLPCRSEAPLLDDAHAQHGDEIEFIGIDVQDSQSAAKQFLAEFGLEFTHFFDRNRAIPNFFGGLGTPITMFFRPHGELVTIHNGVIDERTLALNIDELRQTGS